MDKLERRAYLMDVCHRELEDLVGEDAADVCKAEERVVRKNHLVAHGAGVQSCLVGHG